MIPSLAVAAAIALSAQTATVTPSLDAITVTAARRARPLRAVPESVTVLPRAEIERHPSLTADGLVRTVPGVQTLRRSTSVTADPTAQGLNLRGVGPSGVSRALVLLDGVPVNDPFGGSVYWRALPRLGLDRVEVVPGGGSALYGSAALGGVVELFERSIREDLLELDLTGGTQGTVMLAARATSAGERVRGSIETELMRSDGHRVVAPEARGAIDGYAPSSHATVLGRVAIDPWDDATLTASLGYFGEDQNGGTPLTAASIALVRSSVRLETSWSTLTISAGLTRFEQTRARIAPDRASEVLSATQRVPSNEQGALWVVRAPALGEHRLSAGLEARRVEGEARERVGALNRASGGEQRFLGLFVQDLFALTDALEVSLAVRGDLVHDANGARRTTPGAVRRFDDRLHAELSPRAGVRWSPIEALAFRGSIYRAFRAPTLSELYRPFQVGAVRTAANEALELEHLFGGEVGVEATPVSGWTLRATGFWSVLDRPIVNATLETPLPDGSERQRQNLGEARVRGIELGIEARPIRHLSVLLHYTLVDATVTEHPTLVGRALPHDPAHRATAVIAYRDPSLLFATVELRVLGPAWEDDLNTLELDTAAILSASLAYPFAGGIEVYLAAENLLDQTYVVGRAGIDTIGAPISARAGVRYRAGR